MQIFFRQLHALIAKDLRIEARSGEILLSMALYTLLTGVIFAYAFQKLLSRPTDFYPGVLWVATTFAGTLGMGRLASREQENLALLGITLSPASRGALFFAKAIVALLFMLIVVLLEVPIFALLFSVPLSLSQALGLMLALLVGAAGFAMVGTIVSALLLGSRGRELLLPLALYPLVLPVIILGVSASTELLGGNLTSASSSLQIVLAFDIIFAMLGSFLFEKLLID